MSSTSSSSSSSKVTDEDLKNAVKDLTPAGTQEVADYVGLTRQAVEYRLKQFDDRRGESGVVEEDRSDSRVDSSPSLQTAWLATVNMSFPSAECSPLNDDFP